MNYSTFFINHAFNNPLQYVKGVGPQKAEALSYLGYNQLKQIIFHLPYEYIDRRKITKIYQALNGQLLSQIVTVENIVPKSRNQKITKIICSDGTGRISLIYFHLVKQLLNQFCIGSKIVISGKVEWHYGELQMTHPEIVADHLKAGQVLKIEPIYPASARMSSRSIATTIKEVINSLPVLPEWLPLELINKFQLPSWNQAMQIIHQPQGDDDLEKIELALSRLAFDEIIVEQILLERNRNKILQNRKEQIQFSGLLQKSFIKELPFQLTSNQSQVLEEIASDQRSENHMMRILQGDVGSGKTIVAFLSIINVIEAGFQGIFMVPTELLAKQHFTAFIKLLQNHPEINVELLVSNIKSSDKKIIHERIAKGEVQIIIGTHALIQPNIKFYKPGIIIIDEQHRFGVKQRFELLEKGLFCDLLMMSATPIPRTLSMIYYGNIDVSTIKEKPVGRLPIITSVLSADKMHLLTSSLENKIKDGAKIYWICPLIDESETLSLKTVNERYEALHKIFADKVAVIHSKVKTAHKDEIMQDFASPDGQIKIIVATTVIEVGVDVPDATIMVIEHAERFGLAQMHQLRGRVGRGTKQSYCMLVYSYPLSEIAKQRLNAMKNSNDGFELAERDLEIRGGGRITGTQQSGAPMFLVYDIFKHHKFLEHAKQLSLSHSFIEQKEISILMNIYSGLDESSQIA